MLTRSKSEDNDISFTQFKHKDISRESGNKEDIYLSHDIMILGPIFCIDKWKTKIKIEN